MATVGGGRAGAEVRDRFLRVGGSWGVYLFLGAVCVVIGVLALVWPRHALVALAVLFGVELIVSGLFQLFWAVALTAAPPSSRALLAILGLLGFGIGLFALRDLDLALSVLALVLAIYWICDGVIRIFTAIDYADLPARDLRLVVGGLAVAAGIVVLVWPHVSLLVLAIVLGVWLVLFGFLQILIALGIRSIAART